MDNTFVNRFGNSLRSIMKLRKISGKKLGDAIGVSQKTISRYTTGEVIPRQERILTIGYAIVRLGGHFEDMLVLTGHELDTVDMDSDGNVVAYNCIDDNSVEFIDELCKIFSTLEFRHKLAIVNNFNKIIEIREWELTFIKQFNRAGQDLKHEVLTELESVHFDINKISAKSRLLFSNISFYSGMTADVAQSRLSEEDVRQLVAENKFNEDLVLEFRNYCNNITNSKEASLNTVYNILFFCAADWYILMLLQMLQFSDFGHKVIDKVQFGLMTARLIELLGC